MRGSTMTAWPLRRDLYLLVFDTETESGTCTIRPVNSWPMVTGRRAFVSGCGPVLALGIAKGPAGVYC